MDKLPILITRDTSISTDPVILPISGSPVKKLPIKIFL
jgi:hypothetical protein